MDKHRNMCPSVTYPPLSHTTLAIENAISYKEKEIAFIKKCKCGLFSLVFVIKSQGSMTEILSVRLQKTNKGLKAYLNV